MKKTLRWFRGPVLQPEDDAVSAWRLRVWAGGALALMFALLSTWMLGALFAIPLVVSIVYALYAIVRLNHARIKRVHIPSRDELRARYMDDPNREM